MSSSRIVLASVALVALPCLAAGYPERSIRIVTPYPAASVTDVLARPLGQKLAEAFGQPVVVDNRPGAGGNISGEIVAKSPPDGYTLLIASTAHVVNASLYGKMPYDALRDFAPITIVATSYQLFTSHPSLPVRSVRDVVALARAKPKELNFGSSGIGGTSHLAGELLNALAGIQLTHIPYKGSPQYMIDLLAGRIELAFASVAPGLPHIRAGRIRLLAMTGDKRDPAMPDVPTMSESGVPGYELRSWYGLAGAAGTPAEVVERLRAETTRILALPEIRTIYANAGLAAVSSSPAEFGAYMRTEHERWSKVVKSAGIRAE